MPEKEEFEDRLAELLESLPAPLAEAIKAGFGPTYKKPVKRWYLQKRGEKAILVPKEYDEVIREIYELRKKAKQAKEAEDYEKRIREAHKRSDQPVLAKEIEDAAWFHNLLHDLGKYAYHRLVKYVKWGPDEVEDPKAAFNRLSGFLEELMKFREDAARLQELEEELAVSEIYLTAYQDALERLASQLRTYKWYSDLMVRVMCPMCKQRALNQIVISGAIKVSPESRGV